jgi:hypothetical protein
VLVAHWIEHHRGDTTVGILDRDRDRKGRPAIEIVDGAVERVNDPAQSGVLPFR